MGKWKGIRLSVRKNKDAPIELYDLSKDIGEEKNLADKHPTWSRRWPKRWPIPMPPTRTSAFFQENENCKDPRFWLLLGLLSGLFQSGRAAQERHSLLGR